MAQFDLHRLRSGELVLDCQADLVSKLVQTRFVVPLLETGLVPDPIQGLHPKVTVDGTEYLVVTQLAAAIPAKELSQPIASLEACRYAILNALDFLITGV